MTTAKNQREAKRQMGQFLTPMALACALTAHLKFSREDRVLEPGFGSGSFLIPIIESFMNLYTGSTKNRLELVLTNNIFGIELDPELYQKTLISIEKKWGALPKNHNLLQGDFLEPEYFPVGITHVIGNPPFGGYIAPHLQDALDKTLGKRHGLKIKKETYAFFIVKAIDILKNNGNLLFICSDTFLTIPTMKGLRNLLMLEGTASVKSLDEFSDETKYPMIVLSFNKQSEDHSVIVNGNLVSANSIKATGNLSWSTGPEFEKFFSGDNLSSYVVASSGMTTGKNEYFVREICSDGTILEPYEFEFFDDRITLEKEREKARLNNLPKRKETEILELEKVGATVRNLRITLREKPIVVKLPDPNYRYYNKAITGLVFRPATHVIYWRDEGKAVLTYKKNGNWYLRGVGGMPFFGREGITWRLISSRIDMRYLPPGYILDSGGPCAFLKDGIHRDELYYILGWTITPLCTNILKSVLNHTQNIQSKDIERLPYPHWATKNKEKIVRIVTNMIDLASDGQRFDHKNQEIIELARLFAPAWKVPSNTDSISHPQSSLTL